MEYLVLHKPSIFISYLAESVEDVVNVKTLGFNFQFSKEVMSNVGLVHKELMAFYNDIG